MRARQGLLKQGARALLRGSVRTAERVLSTRPPGCPLGVNGPPSCADCFALIDCDRRFDLDLPAVHERYKSFMVEAHPDKLASRPPAERAALASRAASLTHAVSVLRDPAERAKHLLDLAGRPLGEMTSSELVGSSFLADMLDAREQVEDAAGSEEVLVELERGNARRLSALSADLASAFASSDLDKATRLTAQLQYLQRIATEINEQRQVT